MDIFEKFFHIWNLWGPMHLSINVWSWSGKKSKSWYSLVFNIVTIVLWFHNFHFNRGRDRVKIFSFFQKKFKCKKKRQFLDLKVFPMRDIYIAYCSRDALIGVKRRFLSSWGIDSFSALKDDNYLKYV